VLIFLVAAFCLVKRFYYIRKDNKRTSQINNQRLNLKHMRIIKNFFPFTLIIGAFILFASSCEKEKSGKYSDSDTVVTEISFTDTRDGNAYKIVTIGNQVWMAENLKYLPNVIGAETGSDTEPYCYVYGYDGKDVNEAKATDNYKTYGVLYNWAAAMNGATSSEANPSGVQGICPKGWHLPSNAEWQQLIDYLGGNDIAGGKLKETDTTHWHSPNSGATNESGFTALPGGLRVPNGNFDLIGFYAIWWTTTVSHDSVSWCGVWNDQSDIGYAFNPQNKFGVSIRCVQD